MNTDRMFLEKYYRLAELLTSGAEEVVNKVKYFSDKPAEYLDSEYGEYCCYEEDDLDDLAADPGNLLGSYLWDILYGILNREHFIFRLDWRAFHKDIEFAVNSLLARRGLPAEDALLSEIDGKMPTWDALNIIASKLEPGGLTLAFADDGSDSFPVVIVQNYDLDELKRVSDEIGLSIKTHFA
ncbi:DUF6630 family protein [Pelotomaculum propionicicum]|uniref:DUF6630 family protein n=1 Tax=Pelotomaculum propionicicum TaxID=258475 RepID=UPI003B80E933